MAARASSHRIFEPLGYDVEAIRHPLDERFPEWGESPYFSVTIAEDQDAFANCSTHLYVLIPVFDNGKHYFVGEDETRKAACQGGGWLAEHPEKEEIARRYLQHQPSLIGRLWPTGRGGRVDRARADERPEDEQEDVARNSR